MKRFRVVITTRALLEVEEAFEWLAERSPAAAERWRAALLRAVHTS